MSGCIGSYQASIMIENILFGLITNKSRNEIEVMFNKLSLMGVDSIIPCMECAPCYDFIFYSQTFQKLLDGSISKKDLEGELHMWKKTQLRDDALTGMRRPLTLNDFNKTPANITGVKVYLDQNILSDYAKEKDIKNNIDNLKLNGEMIFFYSPSHLEEIQKIPDLDNKNLIIKALSNLTENTIILPEDDKNLFFKEEPIFGLNRIKKFDGSTEALESLKVVSSKDRKIYLKKYDTEEHKQRIANNDAIFDSLSENEFRELIALSHSSLFDKSNFKNITSRTTALHAIYTLSNILDLLGYKIDKKEKTQKSSLHDIEHLIYALEADLFVTNDKNLQYRAKQIFKFMNSKPEVITLNELLCWNKSV